MNTATTAPISATTAAIANAIVKPSTEGTSFVPGIVCATRSAAPTCPPMTPPIVRMTVFMPVATPVSVGRTLSVISVAIAANAKPTPTPSTSMAARICHDSSCQPARAAAEIADEEHPGGERPLEADAAAEEPGERAGEEQRERARAAGRARPWWRSHRSRSRRAAARRGEPVRRLDEVREQDERPEHREAGDQRGEVREEDLAPVREHAHVDERLVDAQLDQGPRRAARPRPRASPSVRAEVQPQALLR